MENPTPEDVSIKARSPVPDPHTPPSPRHGKQSTMPTIRPAVSLPDIVKALAVLQDGLRQLALAGATVRAPQVNELGILILAAKLDGHTLGVGPDGNFLVDSISVMAERAE